MLFILRKSQLALFNMPVHVAGSYRKDGTYVKPHMRTARVAMKPHEQGHLFGAPPEAPAAAKKTPKLDKFLAKHGGEARMRSTLMEMRPEQRAKLIDAMAHIDGLDPSAVTERLGMHAADLKSAAPEVVPEKKAEPVVEGEKEAAAPAEENPAPEEKPTEPAHEIVEHSTGKGKVLRGIVRTDLTGHQAAAIDPYTFRKNGGWFIRDKHLEQAAAVEVAPKYEPGEEEKRAENAAAVDRSKEQAAKLRAAGQKLADQANADLGRDRLANTARRARMAAGAEEEASKRLAIAGEGVFFGSDQKAQAFRSWLDERGADVEKLPENTFKGSDLPAQTGANARMLVIAKPAEAAAAPAPAEKPMKNFGWDAVKLADAYSMDELSKLRAQVEAEHANPFDEKNRYTENGKSTLNLYDQKGMKKLQALAWAVTYKLQEKRAAADAGPKEGDRNAEGLVFRGGRWHREDAPAAVVEQAAPVDDGRVTIAAALHDGTTIRDGKGNLYRVHYQRNHLVLAHPIVDGKAQVNADSTVRFWTSPDMPPAGENDRLDPIYPVESAAQAAEPAPAAEPAMPPASNPDVELAEDREDLADELARDPHSEKAKDLVRKVAERVAAQDEPNLDDVDNPNSAAYRYADTGYIAGSRKEEAAAQVITRAKKEGARVFATAIDWDDLEQNPREAKELITKSNLFGSVDWQALRDGGMDPGAAFLIDRIYASIGQEPSSETSQARKDYVTGLQSLRDRLEACKTPADVTAVLDNLREEFDGTILTAEESERYAAHSKEASALYEEYRALEAENDKHYKAMQSAKSEMYSIEHEVEKRARRGWAPKPELNEKLAEAKARVAEFDKKWGDSLQATRPRRDEIDAARSELGRKREVIKLLAKVRNQTENPMHRAWTLMGDRFLGVIRYRSHKGSDAFANHVASAKVGKIDWSWMEKETSRSPRVSKESARFQLKVADSFERVGGRKVVADSTAALKSMFNLRDVQSGNWVLRDVASAKFHTEQSAAAFADLADLLRAEDEQVSLNGRLAMAFGARGHGKGSGKAHYEPIQRVINLTKMGGGGSLGHEWFHALDNMAKEAEGMGQSGADDFVTANPDLLPPGELRDATHALRAAMLEGPHYPSTVVPYTAADVRIAKRNVDSGLGAIGRKIKAAGNVHDAVRAIDEQLGPKNGENLKTRQKRLHADWRRIAIAYYGGNPEGGEIEVRAGKPTSSFALEARVLDQGDASYWSTTEEMAARAFQSWIEDRLADKGRRNDYLSSLADNRYHFDPLTGMQWKPYPEGEERERINAAFDRFVAAVKSSNTLAKALEVMGAF